MSIAAWVLVYGAGCLFLWRAKRWTPRTHLMYLAGTLPILLAGLVVMAWGSTDAAVVYIIISFLIYTVPFLLWIWLAIRRREQQPADVLAADEELRWDLGRRPADET